MRPRATKDKRSACHSLAIGSVAGLILDELRADRAANLPHILPGLEFALLVPYLGPQALNYS